MYGWNLTGSWRVIGGELIGDGSDTAGSSYSRFALMDGITAPDVFCLEADVMVNQPGDRGHVGFVRGLQDPTLFSTTYLRTHWDEVTTWQAPYSGVEHKLKQISLTNNVYYDLKLFVDYNNDVVRVMLS